MTPVVLHPDACALTEHAYSKPAHAEVRLILADQQPREPATPIFRRFLKMSAPRAVSLAQPQRPKAADQRFFSFDVLFGTSHDGNMKAKAYYPMNTPLPVCCDSPNIRPYSRFGRKPLNTARNCRFLWPVCPYMLRPLNSSRRFPILLFAYPLTVMGLWGGIRVDASAHVMTARAKSFQIFICRATLSAAVF